MSASSSEPIVPFGFEWGYDEDEDGEDYPNTLLIGNPADVPPLTIEIGNVLPHKEILILPISEITEVHEIYHHFELAFVPGLLSALTEITVVDDQNWLISTGRDPLSNSIYLLWIGEEPIPLDAGFAKDVILMNVAAQDEGTETRVTIRWQFKINHENGIDIFNAMKIHGQDDKYATSTNKELTMAKATGKTNIPLFVGFTGSNRVLNLNGQSSDLQVRVTNTNLPGSSGSDITFKQNSQLVVLLEVGDAQGTPWALGTEDQINEVTITIAGWQQSPARPESVIAGSVVKALKWTFTPKKDFLLDPQETILIDITGIKTNHPTGPSNLYLRYNSIDGYKDGQFVCQIEKTRLIYADEKVGIGTKSPTALLDVAGDAAFSGHVGIGMASSPSPSDLDVVGTIRGKTLDISGDATGDGKITGKTLDISGDTTIDGKISHSGTNHLHIAGHACVDGRLLVGTNSLPEGDEMLHVEGGIHAKNVSIADGESGISLINKKGNLYINNTAAMVFEKFHYSLEKNNTAQTITHFFHNYHNDYWVPIISGFSARIYSSDFEGVSINACFDKETSEIGITFKALGSGKVLREAGADVIFVNRSLVS